MFTRLAQIESSEVVGEQSGRYRVRRQRRAIGGEVAKGTAMLVHKRRGSEHIVGICAIVRLRVHVIHGGQLSARGRRVLCVGTYSPCVHCGRAGWWVAGRDQRLYGNGRISRELVLL